MLKVYWKSAVLSLEQKIDHCKFLFGALLALSEKMVYLNKLAESRRGAKNSHRVRQNKQVYFLLFAEDVIGEESILHSRFWNSSHTTTLTQMVLVLSKVTEM